MHEDQRSDECWDLARWRESRETNKRVNGVVRASPSVSRHRTGLPPFKSPRRQKTSTSRSKPPTPRLRHDDSQIDFVSVDSPVGLSRVDSQLLTDHQKEVRSRQQADESSNFPYLRSLLRSGAGRTKDEVSAFPMSPSLSAMEVPAAQGGTPRSRPSVARGPLDDFINSSPTPSRNIGHLSRSNADARMSSSPPPPMSKAAIPVDDPPSSPPYEQSMIAVDEQEQQTPPLEEGHLSTLVADEVDSDADRPVAGPAANNERSMSELDPPEEADTPDAQLRSTFEVFIDRLTRSNRAESDSDVREPSLQTSDDTKDVTRVVDSFKGSTSAVIDLTGDHHDDPAPHYSTESPTNSQTANRRGSVDTPGSPRTPQPSKRKRAGEQFGRAKRSKHDNSHPGTQSDSAALPMLIDDADAIKRATRSSPWTASTPPNRLSRTPPSADSPSEDNNNDNMTMNTRGTRRNQRMASPQGPEGRKGDLSGRRLRSGKTTGYHSSRPPANIYSRVELRCWRCAGSNEPRLEEGPCRSKLEGGLRTVERVYEGPVDIWSCLSRKRRCTDCQSHKNGGSQRTLPRTDWRWFKQLDRQRTAEGTSIFKSDCHQSGEGLGQ